jgi:hydrogenase maturation protein HypF
MGPVLGVSLDGTGYGPDDTIWGGEFLLYKNGVFARTAHLEPFPLPGGDAAVRHVWRLALSVLLTSGVEEVSFGGLAPVSEEERNTVVRMIQKGTNCPLTSSMGRLFDAVAVLAGLGPTVSYEGEAAMRLEAMCGDDYRPYPIEISGDCPARILLRPIVEGVLSDIGDSPTLSSRFHATIAHAVLEVARRTRDNEGANTVALSGGVFQNRVLVELTRGLLEEDGLRVLTNRLVPPNDGGISLGQAWIASRRKES